MATAAVRWERMTMPAGGALVLLTLAITFWLDEGNIYVLMAFAAGTMAIVGSLYRYVEIRSPGDERVKKTFAFAAPNAWLTTMLLLMGLVALASLGDLAHMSLVRLLALITFMTLAVFAGWYAYYAMRGDIE